MNIEPATYVVIHHSDDWDVDPEVVLATTDLGHAMEETKKFPLTRERFPEYRELEGWSKGHLDVRMHMNEDGTWDARVFDGK